jgi:hypothetical protein
MIFTLKITLLESKPTIYRILEIDSSFTLLELHAAIQIAMGWTNSHLHEFIDGEVHYAVPSPEDADYGFKPVDESKVVLSEVFKKEGDSLEYAYDFGDGWQHSVKLSEIKETSLLIPRCLEGKNACPPEDCGGVYGYEDILVALKDPENEEHTELLEWVGDGFDPEYFSVDEVNEHLKSYKDLCDITLYMDDY